MNDTACSSLASLDDFLWSSPYSVIATCQRINTVVSGPIRATVLLVQHNLSTICSPVSKISHHVMMMKLAGSKTSVASQAVLRRLERQLALQLSCHLPLDAKARKSERNSQSLSREAVMNSSDIDHPLAKDGLGSVLIKAI